MLYTANWILKALWDSKEINKIGKGRGTYYRKNPKEEDNL